MIEWLTSGVEYTVADCIAGMTASYPERAWEGRCGR
jgi:hypothetical protein